MKHFVILPTIAIKRLAIWGPLGKDDGCDDRCGARVKENVRLLVAGIKICNYQRLGKFELTLYLGDRGP